MLDMQGYSPPPLVHAMIQSSGPASHQSPPLHAFGRESQFLTLEVIHPLQTTLLQPGIVSMRVGLSYDLLRFFLRCSMWPGGGANAECTCRAFYYFARDDTVVDADRQLVTGTQMRSRNADTRKTRGSKCGV